MKIRAIVLLGTVAAVCLLLLTLQMRGHGDGASDLLAIVTTPVQSALARINRTTVGVWVENGGVEVRVEDDGSGGAHPAKGSGLAGLQQRVLAADGRLEISSPEGGPTVVSAWFPVGGP